MELGQRDDIACHISAPLQLFGGPGYWSHGKEPGQVDKLVKTTPIHRGMGKQGQGTAFHGCPEPSTQGRGWQAHMPVSACEVLLTWLLRSPVVRGTGETGTVTDLTL